MPNLSEFTTLLSPIFSNGSNSLGTTTIKTQTLAILARWMSMRGRSFAKVKATNAVEVQKKAFSKVFARMVQRCLREQGLLCHIWKSKPYLTEANKKKQWL